MKMTCWTRLSFGLALVAGVAGAACAAQMPGEGITVSKDNRTIAITATDSVTVTADVATVHVGYLLYAADQDTVYAMASKVSNSVVDALRAAGVPTDAIESEAQNIGLVQIYGDNGWTAEDKAQRKFVASQSWTVRGSANDAARILDVAVKAGANQSGQIDWGLKDADTPVAAAASKALKHARSIAEAMAGGLSAKLGGLVFASNQAPTSPVLAGYYYGTGSVALQKAVEPLSVAPKRIEKTATVYAVFAIE